MLTGHTIDEVVEFALRATHHPTGETGYQGGEGQYAATGEVLRADAVGRNECFGFEGRLDFIDQRGMEFVARFSCIPLEK